MHFDGGVVWCGVMWWAFQRSVVKLQFPKISLEISKVTQTCMAQLAQSIELSC